MNNSRLLFTWYAPFETGGVQTFLANFASEASRRGVQVWIASTHAHEGPLRPRFDLPNVTTLDWTSFTPAFYNKTGDGQRVCRLIMNDLACIRPHAVWLNDCAAFGLGCVPLLRRVRKFCHLFDGIRTDQAQESYITNRLPYLSSLDGVTCVDPNLADRFSRLLPQFPQERVRFLPNGVHRAAGERQPDPAGALRIVYVGRLAQKQKRVRDLPSICRKLADTDTNYHFTIIGEGDEEGHLRERFASLGLSAKVTFRGFVSPELLPALYLQQDVVINVSDYEGRSSSLIEAMAAGCLPVCSDLPSVRGLLGDHPYGSICPVGDIETFAKALVRLAKIDRGPLHVAVRAAVADLTIARMVDRYFEFWSDARQRRPLQPWPDDPNEMWGRLWNGWSLTKHNPWIPHPHPLKQILRRFRQFIQGEPPTPATTPKF